tara:strand:- start:168 stop:599 length:432 start_codon:yes stop_codon:yes gene_type:complete
MVAKAERIEGATKTLVGEAAWEVLKLTVDQASGKCAPFLIGGKKLASIHSPTLAAATEIFINASNWSSVTQPDTDTGFVDNQIIPLDADFKKLFDESDTEVKLPSSNGDKVHSIPNVGYIKWCQLELENAQAADTVFYAILKG